MSEKDLSDESTPRDFEVEEENEASRNITSTVGGLNDSVGAVQTEEVEDDDAVDISPYRNMRSVGRIGMS